MNAHTLLLIVAIILWFFAGVIGMIRPQGSPVQLGWLGMFFYGLSLLVH
jgi:hypothetical protein